MNDAADERRYTKIWPTGIEQGAQESPRVTNRLIRRNVYAFRPQRADYNPPFRAPDLKLAGSDVMDELEKIADAKAHVSGRGIIEQLRGEMEALHRQHSETSGAWHERADPVSWFYLLQQTIKVLRGHRPALEYLEIFLVRSPYQCVPRE